MSSPRQAPSRKVPSPDPKRDYVHYVRYVHIVLSRVLTMCGVTAHSAHSAHSGFRSDCMLS